jgi:hypothetical protein
MSENLLTPSSLAGPEAIKRLFTHLVDAPANNPEADVLHSDADAAWQTHPVLEINQDQITGKFRRESVAYFLGSLPGFSIFIDVETDQGNQNLQLRFNGRAPAFDIKSAIHKGSTLEITPRAIDYASMTTEQAFNWDEIIKSTRHERQLTTDPLYLVVFRSLLKEGADTSELMEHDRRAHEAALESPALIHYHGGKPNESGRALSFCLWENPVAAKAISRDSRHMNARAMVASYESYSIEKYNVQHADEQVRLEPVI